VAQTKTPQPFDRDVLEIVRLLFRGWRRTRVLTDDSATHGAAVQVLPTGVSSVLRSQNDSNTVIKPFRNLSAMSGIGTRWRFLRARF